MENYKIIDTRLAISILKMNEKEISELLKFVDEFSLVFFKEGSNNSWTKFVSCVCSELKIPNTKGNVAYKVCKNDDYKRIVFKYSSLLRNLMWYEVLNDLFRVMSEDKRKQHFINFVQDVLCNYSDRRIMLENLSKLNDLKIEGFGYDPNISFDGEYTISVGKSLYMENQYFVRGICSDGDKNWYPEIETGKYSFDLKNANYVIRYNKNTINSNGVSMICNTLLFEQKTLPSYSELYDSSCLPNIDYDMVKSKTDVFVSIYNLELLKENALKLYEELENSLSIFDNQIFSKDELLASKRKIRQIEELINNIDDMIMNAIARYDEKGIMSASELKKSLQKKDNINKR